MARLSTCVAELSGARTDCEEGVTSNRFLYALAVFLSNTCDYHEDSNNVFCVLRRYKM